MADRFYLGEAANGADTGAEIPLDAEESHHLLRVMRKHPGDAVRAFGAGHEFEAVVARADGKIAVLRLGSEVPALRPPAFRALYIVPWLKGGRTEFLVHKLTELGATGFVVFRAQREAAAPGDDKIDQLRRVALEACKQCERADIPTLAMASDLRTAVRDLGFPDGRALRLAERAPQRRNLSAALQGLLPSATADANSLRHDTNSSASNLGPLAIASGPEGGFHPDELLDLDELEPVTLGPRILRAETAPLVAAALILAAGGDL